MSVACPTRQVVNRIGERWTLLVLYALSGGTRRFSELRREVEGISQRMLTQTVRELERDGLVHRRVYAEVPPRVEYSLTDLGADLNLQVATLREWAYANMDAVESSRRAFDARTAR